ncbi:hypothetical protein DB347_00065 [Opitutaceae bacterium EW11]|nr:hypothetical protein DB347_00065 [Opitutaceae bacterium EW11]
MNTDIVSAIELTASAAITVAALSSLLPTLRARTSALLLFGLWFIAVGLFGAIQLFGPRHLGPPGLGLSVMLPILALTGSATMHPALRVRIREAPLTLLIAMNALRVLGVSFLILLGEGRISPTFALSAGWGDIAVGFAAVPVALLARRRSPLSVGVVAVWNTLGLLDLVTAVALGVMSAAGTPLNFIHEAPGSGVMTTLPYLFIPGFLVPIFATSHLLVYYKLKHRAWGTHTSIAPEPAEGIPLNSRQGA